MKIIVTGGAGFIGSHVADALIRKGHEVVIIDNLSTGLKENINSKAIFYYQDLLEHDKVREIFEREKPEIIHHLAAQIDVRKSVADPVYDAKINILSTLNLIELAKQYNTKHFIFSSSGGAIYGDTEVPTPEHATEKPVSPYGCAKLAIEKYLDFYKQVHGLKFTSLRYANVYGPRQNPLGEAGVIAIFLNNLLAEKQCFIFGGKQTRDFVFVEDVVKANLLALNDNKSDVYNVGTGVETNINEIFSEINAFFQSKFEPKLREMKKGEQMKSCLDFSKKKQHLGWIPETDLDTGMKKTYEWFLENSKRFRLS